jgi:transcription antitermination factor NusB
MGKRRRARELAIQVLFHLEYNPGDPEESFATICKSFLPPKEVRSFSKDLVLGVWKNKEDLDRLIGRASKNWRIERMSRVDRNILRIAVFEVVYMGEIPPKVSIDEAVELGKKYGSEESGAFINGVLDHIYNQLGAKEEAGETPSESR